MNRIKNYRKIWSKINGSIPNDEEGRPYEIHHIDGNRNNNNIENLQCISIQEHYNIHYMQKDYGACVMIAKRMNLPKDHISSIQMGVKRPGIGGVKKGTTPWNKGISGYKLKISQEGKNKKINAVKKNCIITDSDALKIRSDYDKKVIINNSDIGKTMRNGKIMTYDRAFCIEYSKIYHVSNQYIYRIIKNVAKIV